MGWAIACGRIWRTLRPALRPGSQKDRAACKRALLAHAGQRVNREIQDIAAALQQLHPGIRAFVLERLAAILDGSETEADVDDLIAELIADSLRTV